MKIRRFSGHPQVRDWAIIPFQGEYQVLAGTENWTMLTHNYTMEDNSHSVTGNRTRISTRAGSLLPRYSSAVCFSSLICFSWSIILRCLYLMIARVLDLCSPCQFILTFVSSLLSFVCIPPFPHRKSDQSDPYLVYCGQQHIQRNKPQYSLFPKDTLHIDALHSILTVGKCAEYTHVVLYHHKY